MQDGRASPRKRWLFCGLILTAAVLIMVAISTDVLRRARGMRATAMPAASILSASEGSPVKAIVRLGESSDPRNYSADLLESKAENLYSNSGVPIRIELAEDASIVMGSPSDIKSGAVVQASGILAAKQTLRVHQLVILTGYVRVEP